MKPSAKYDFPVSVREQVWEEETDTASLYTGIFDVHLNFSIDIMFVPDVGKAIDKTLLASLPDDFDEISTSLEARLSVFTYSKYAVTPNSLLTDTEEIIQPENSSDKCVVFYISNEQFQIFQQELSEISEQFVSVHDSQPISKNSDLGSMNFILSAIIQSNNFDPKDRFLLQ